MEADLFINWFDILKDHCLHSSKAIKISSVKLALTQQLSKRQHPRDNVLCDLRNFTQFSGKLTPELQLLFAIGSFSASCFPTGCSSL